jgi:hypothetical protein
MDNPPSQADVGELDQAVWRAGNAALGTGGPDRDEMTRLTESLAAVRDLAELWRSGAPPDPSAWPGPLTDL